MTFRIAGYSRVSTDEQASVVEGSLENQKHRMKSFVDIKNLQDKNWGHIVDFYVDDGYSAGDTNRPQYQRLIKDIKSGKINMIMVTELSRLSRDISDFCVLKKLFDEHHVSFLSIKEQFDTSTPAGELMLYQLISLAQFERKQTAERVAVNCHARSLRGLLNGGPAILGYDKHETNKTTFIVNEEEARQVRDIFNTYKTHRTISRTIQEIEALEIKPKARKRDHNRLVAEGRWSIDSLSFVLQNKAYIALREINKANKDKDESHLKPWQKYSVVKASWPAIVDKELFEEVQNILEENRSKERLRLETSVKRVFFASQILICGDCGRPLVGSSAHGRNKVHRYYVHASKKGDVITCARKRYSADEIETGLVDRLSEILLRAGHFEKVSENIRKNVAVNPEEIKNQIHTLEMELNKSSLAIKRTFKLQAEMDADSDGIKLVAHELQELGRKKKSLEASLMELKAKADYTSEVEESVISLKDRIEQFNRGWKKASVMTRKSLLKNLLFAVVVTPKGLQIEYRLKDGLNSDANGSRSPGALEAQNNVIEMAEKRRAKSSGSVPDSESCDSTDSNFRHKKTNLAAGSVNPSNVGNEKLQVVGIGSGNHYLPELSQVHRKTTFSGAEKQRVFENLIDLYTNGLSLSDIAKQTGKPKTTIRSLLVKAGVRIRSSVSAPFSTAIRDSAKTNAAPYFGFCFFQGQVIPDPKEFVNLQLIHELWKSGANPNRIADSLNKKKIRPRCAQKWNRNSIVKIINRFENKSVILKNGGKYELR